ncbi:unnamed protein product [Lampetra planeri]
MSPEALRCAALRCVARTRAPGACESARRLREPSYSPGRSPGRSPRPAAAAFARPPVVGGANTAVESARLLAAPLWRRQRRRRNRGEGAGEPRTRVASRDALTECLQGQLRDAHRKLSR